MSKRRSSAWFAEHDLAGFLHRASLRAAGIASDGLDGRPVVGICNPWSEVVNCNVHFRGLAAAVKRGVAAAGGLPLEFPVSSLGENLQKPTTMLFRNLMAMDVEEAIRSYPFDAVVLIGGCDKTQPAQLMGAASANVPAIAITGGTVEAAMYRGRELSVGTDLWRYTDDLRAGRISLAEYDELEAAWIPGPGHCNEMGTASTMACITEALGMALPGTATIAALHPDRAAAAEATGRRAVEIARAGLTPGDVLTPAAFDNAITMLCAIGGSTNAVVHLLALARRTGYELPLARFDEISRSTPLVADVRPAGAGLVSALHAAGGVPALLTVLAPLLAGDAVTIGGTTLAAGARPVTGPAIRSLDAPVAGPGGLAVVRGSLAPRGAVLKVAAADPGLLSHRGPAVVFESVADVAARIDDSSLAITPASVLVLRNVGPIGGPGMPEWGMVPIPARLLAAGVRDMVRVSDARMSGTAFGTCVLHVAPEAHAGGPLAAVHDGDIIALDVAQRRLDLEVPADEVARRLRDAPPPPARYERGYGRLHAEHVLQADEGCDLDFLAGRSDAAGALPYGLGTGFVGGW
jgi:dihydroxy-acid dehydratase